MTIEGKSAPLPSFPERFNLADYLLDARVREGRGDSPAIFQGERTYTYKDVQLLANRTGNVLRELGARPEERVLLILPDGIEFAAAWFATLKIGSVFAMANIIHPAEDYAYYLNYTRAPVAVVAESVLPKIEQVLSKSPYLKRLLVVEEKPGEGKVTRHPTFHAMTESASAELENFDTGRDDIAGWLFTSGTTGHPKAAVHFHQDFAYNVETYSRQIVKYTDADITVSVPKLYFGYATGPNLMFPFAAGGATALYSERCTPEKVFEMIERHRPTVLTSVPTMINAMLQMPGGKDRDLSSLRVCLSAGEALPGELYKRWQETFGIEILDGIGSAEMFHIYISNRLGEVVPGALGKLVPGYEARIVGPDGADAAVGELGTLWIRGGSTALCYWGDKEKSRVTFMGDTCVTGDQFKLDAEGLFWYGGRADDMLKVSGMFVTPLEIEDCLYKHPAVRDLCIVGAKDKGGLTRPKAYVTLKEGFAPSDDLAREFKDLAKANLSPYKYPRWVAFVEELPRSDRGKVQRKLIREGYSLKPVHPEVDLGGKE
jgi:benzoate-CoA ligase family protein